MFKPFLPPEAAVVTKFREAAVPNIRRVRAIQIPGDRRPLTLAREWRD
jgi:hypothetical protein